MAARSMGYAHRRVGWFFCLPQPGNRLRSERAELHHHQRRGGGGGGRCAGPGRWRILPAAVPGPVRSAGARIRHRVPPQDIPQLRGMSLPGGAIVRQVRLRVLYGKPHRPVPVAFEGCLSQRVLRLQSRRRTRQFGSCGPGTVARLFGSSNPHSRR
ncbi:hypothetical protein BGLA2_1000046 [Burkholderia gladioli]|nr:hypothetical protein BGLA2_1000046 [Burkholderia gladioli]